MKTTRLMVLVLSLFWPVAGNAQDRAFERWFISVNAVSQASNRSTVYDPLSHPPSDPIQRYGVDYVTPDGPAFDLGGGMRVWRNLSVGLGASRFDAVVRHGRDGSTAGLQLRLRLHGPPHRPDRVGHSCANDRVPWAIPSWPGPRAPRRGRFPRRHWRKDPILKP